MPLRNRATWKLLEKSLRGWGSWLMKPSLRFNRPPKDYLTTAEGLPSTAQANLRVPWDWHGYSKVSTLSRRRGWGLPCFDIVGQMKRPFGSRRPRALPTPTIASPLGFPHSLVSLSLKRPWLASARRDGS